MGCLTWRSLAALSNGEREGRWAGWHAAVLLLHVQFFSFQVNYPFSVYVCVAVWGRPPRALIFECEREVFFFRQGPSETSLTQLPQSCSHMMAYTDLRAQTKACIWSHICDWDGCDVTSFLLYSQNLSLLISVRSNKGRGEAGKAF